MRLLFDEQLSEKLIVLLRDTFPTLCMFDCSVRVVQRITESGSSPASTIVFSSRKTKTFTA